MSHKYGLNQGPRRTSYGTIKNFNDPESASLLSVIKEETSMNSIATSSFQESASNNNNNNKDKRPTGFFSLSYVAWALVAISSLSITVLATKSLFWFPSSSSYASSNATSTNAMRSTYTSSHAGLSKIPFPSIDRSEFGQNPIAASSIVNPKLFDSSLLGTGNSLLKVPFPTGAFWTNLVIEPTADRKLSYPIMSYPYAYKWNPNMLQVSLPALRPLMDAVSLRHIFIADLTLAVDESIAQRYVNYFDSMSVTLRFESTSDSSNYWETYIVQGSPYITSRYENMVPKVQALSIFKGISCIGNNTSDTCAALDSGGDGNTFTLRGTQFSITTNENLKWLVFFSEPVTLVFDSIRKTSITTAESFTGIMRLALVPPSQELLTKFTSQFPQSFNNVDLEESTGVSQLIRHSTAYPTGVDLSWSFPSKDKSTLKFEYKVQQMQSSNSGGSNTKSPLLMLALPHHYDVLSQQTTSSEYTVLSDQSQFDLSYRTIKGPMTAVVGNAWSLSEQLTTVGFDYEATVKKASKLSDNIKTTILDQVILDVNYVLPTLDENVYGYGKQVARLAQLVHIAKTLIGSNESSSIGTKYTSAVDDAQMVLHDFLTAFLTGKTDDSLVYDSNFGGLITKDGLDDYMNDFGNGWYNDHHFHYGYYLYASALMGQWNETFIEEYGDFIDAMMYDVTDGHSQSSEDGGKGAFFPFARHKAWFDGHSFASGLFPFASGKSMESSTESINCYYGAYLWCMVRGTYNLRTDQFNFARLLLATEIRGVQTYWHMNAASNTTDSLYNSVLAKNLMIGNLGMMDATVSTWFGNNPLYVHMINFLPVTAITRELFSTEYVEEEFTNVIEPIYSNIEMAWKGYVICDLALLDPNKAFDDALNLRSFELDQAISQSQVLYFASTMEDFDESKITGSVASGESETENASESDSALCMYNSGCSALGLTGRCCPPTSGGENLGCCSQSSGTQGYGESEAASNVTKTSDTDDSSLCSQHSACEAAGLLGYCCPTAAGVQLSCCDA